MNKLVFDVGGTALKYSLMTNDAEILEKGEVPTPKESQAQFLDTLKDVFDKYKDQVDGIAMSLPGTIDATTGHVYAPGALSYNYDTDLGPAIEKKCGVPVYMQNDGKAAALAEVWKGNLADVENGVVIILGTGIGGGIIQNKRVLPGNNLFAGELSYVSLGMDGFFKDAWAVKGSTSALTGTVAAIKGVDKHEMNGFKVFELIEAGDEETIAAFENFCKVNAVGIYNLQCILDPQKMLVGGGISRQPKVVEGIRKELDMIYDALPFPIPRAKVDVCKHFNDSNMIGALYNFLVMNGDIKD